MSSIRKQRGPGTQEEESPPTDAACITKPNWCAWYITSTQLQTGKLAEQNPLHRTARDINIHHQHNQNIRSNPTNANRHRYTIRRLTPTTTRPNASYTNIPRNARAYTHTKPHWPHRPLNHIRYRPPHDAWHWPAHSKWPGMDPTGTEISTYE